MSAGKSRKDCGKVWVEGESFEYIKVGHFGVPQEKSCVKASNEMY